MPVNSREQTKQSLLGLDVPNRKYCYDAYVKDNVRKRYCYRDYGAKVMSYAAGECGTVSDAYILYAIAILGIADRGSIRLFLKNLKKKNPSLLIGNMDAEEGLRKRISALAKLGYIFSMEPQYYDANGKIEQAAYYTISADANEFVGHRLDKRVPYNHWLEAVSQCKMVEWACCSYIGSMICQHGNFVEYLDGVFKSKMLGQYFFPSEIKYFNGEENYYVALIGGYLYRDDTIQTEIDFERSKATKISAIRNYLAVRSKTGHTAVVVCVDTLMDLQNFVELIINTGQLIDFLPDIYFTGEGIFQNVKYLEEAFLSVELVDSANDHETGTQNKERLYTFSSKVPGFLTKKV